MKQRRVTRRPAVRRTAASRPASFFARFQPKRLKAFILSREGAIFFAKVVGAGFLLIFLVFLYFAKDLPSPNKINAILNAQTTKFYDRTGNTVLYEVYGDQNRTVVDLSQIAPDAQHATIAVEDRNFYHEGAFSFIGILRAAFVDLFHRGSGIQGASTITQQYVKNALLTPSRSIGRKIKELILSIEISSFYSKNDILKLYLNEIPYGSNAYGIEAACRTFFSYHGTVSCASKLTIDESATLAAMLQAPTYYSPYGQHTDDLKARKDLILGLMAEQHYITSAQADAAKSVDTLAKVNPTQNLYANITAPHFVLYTQELLEQKYGSQLVTEGGLKVITTLDLSKQKAAEDAVAANMRSVRALGGSNAALVAADPNNGQIEAMVGSYNFSDPKFGAFNAAIAQRQPGSSFKPFVYATAWGRNYNYGPGTTLYDVPTDFGGGYKPRNFSGTNYGVQSMRTAIDGSLNIPAVKTLYMVGIGSAIDTAHRLGITTLNDGAGTYGLSLVLGSGEVRLVDMVNAYESFANMGVHYDPTPILKVQDGKGNVLEDHSQPPKNPTRVLDPQVAYLMNNVLSDNNARAFIFGINNPLTVSGHTVAAKTGTTQNYNDAWTMGYTPSLVAGVWAGNNDNSPMSAEAADVAAPIWHSFMTKALTGPNENWNQPAGIKKVTLDAVTGKAPTAATKQTRTDIFGSWYNPPTAADTGQSAQVDKVSGKLATSCTPPLAIQTVFSTNIQAEIPPNDPSFARWNPPVQALATSLGYQSGGTLPTQNDDVHHCDDIKPKVTLTASSTGGGNYHLKVTWTSGTFTINKLDVSFDDQIISTLSVDSNTANPYEFDYAPAGSGGHAFKAVVTDTALYTDESDVNISLSGGGGFQGFSPNSQNFPCCNGSIIFDWSSLSGADHYRLTIQGAASHQFDNINGTSKSVPMANNTPPGSYSWYVQAIDGGGNPIAKSSPLSFTVN